MNQPPRKNARARWGAARSAPPPDHDAAAARASRALRNRRNNPVVRASLAILIAASVMVALVMREEGMRAVDAPTVRVDLDAAHALRGFSVARTSAEAAAERAVPLRAGGARALSVAHAGSEDGVVSPCDARAPSAHIPPGPIAHVLGMHDSPLWQRQTAALLSAAIITAFPVDARPAARDVIERALGGRSILSVVNAEHGIFSLADDGSIVTTVTTFSPRNELTYVTVSLQSISFAAAIADRKTLRLAQPHHIPSAHFLDAYESTRRHRQSRACYVLHDMRHVRIRRLLRVYAAVLSLFLDECLYLTIIVDFVMWSLVPIVTPYCATTPPHIRGSGTTASIVQYGDTMATSSRYHELNNGGGASRRLLLIFSSASATCLVSRNIFVEFPLHIMMKAAWGSTLALLAVQEFTTVALRSGQIVPDHTQPFIVLGSL